MRGRRDPERTCAGCRGTAPKMTLLRVVLSPEGRVRADPAGKAPGRGAYLHRDLSCIAAATGRGALARALRTSLDAEEAATLRAEIERIVGM